MRKLKREVPFMAPLTIALVLVAVAVVAGLAFALSKAMAAAKEKTAAEALAARQFEESAEWSSIRTELERFIRSFQDDWVNLRDDFIRQNMHERTGHTLAYLARTKEWRSKGIRNVVEDFELTDIRLESMTSDSYRVVVTSRGRDYLVHKDGTITASPLNAPVRCFSCHGPYVRYPSRNDLPVRTFVETWEFLRKDSRLVLAGVWCDDPTASSSGGATESED